MQELSVEVKEFISRRFDQDCHWTDGNCYWFANILVTRFPSLDIYYFPHQGHFVAGNAWEFYDWTGRVEPLKDEPAILLYDLKQNDPLWYSHLIRDCIR